MVSKSRKAYEDFESDAYYSRKAFANIVAPYLYNKYGITFTKAEGSGNELLESMDRESGIDYFMHGYKGMTKPHSLGSRIQWFPTYDQARYFNTMTIRNSRPSGARTEKEKTFFSIDEGEDFATYSIHVYIWGDKESDDGKIVRINHAKTKELYDLVKIDLARGRDNQILVNKDPIPNTDDTTFIAVNMDFYEAARNGTIYEEESKCQKSLKNMNMDFLM